MTAACTHCGRQWIVSIRTSPTGYVCPDCDLRQRYIAAGVIVPEERMESYDEGNHVGHYRQAQ